MRAKGTASWFPAGLSRVPRLSHPTPPCFSSPLVGNPADRVLHVTSTHLGSLLCHCTQLYGLLCSFCCKIKSNLSLAPGEDTASEGKVFIALLLLACLELWLSPAARLQVMSNLQLISTKSSVHLADYHRNCRLPWQPSGKALSGWGVRALRGLWFGATGPCEPAAAFAYPASGGMCRPAREGCPPPFLLARSSLQLLEFLYCSKHVLSSLFLLPAQQDLQRWEQHGAIRLTDTVKHLRRQQCGRNVQFDT